MGTWVLFLGMKRQLCEPDHLPPSSADTDIARTVEMYLHSYVQERLSPD